MERLASNQDGFGVIKNTRNHKSQAQEIDKCPALEVIEGGEGDCNEKPVDVLSSEFEANTSQNGNVDNTATKFNAFASSFHVTEDNRVSEVLPRLTEDMLKIADDDEPKILRSHFGDDNPVGTTKTAAQTIEPTNMGTEKAQVDTTISTPFALAEETAIVDDCCGETEEDLKTDTVPVLDDKKMMPKKPKG